MPVSTMQFYEDFTALSLGDFTDPDFTVYDGAAADIVSGAPSGNVLANDPADSTNVIRIGYTAESHGADAEVGVIRAYPNDGSDSTIALTLGSSGAGYNFSASLGSETCYAARWLDDAIIIYRVVNGTVTQVASFANFGLPANQDEFRLKVTRSGGQAIVDVLINDVVELSYTDNSPITFSGGVASVSFKGLTNLNSTTYGFGVEGLPATGNPGLTSKTLERAGVAVAASTAAVFIWAGHGVDIDATAADYKNTSASLSSGVLGDIDLSSTSINIGNNITVVVLPASGGPGIIIETTAEEIV